MANKKFQSKRPELSIAEVLSQYECTLDDLIHEAALGELKIYILADNWLVDAVFSFNTQNLAQGVKDTDGQEKKVERYENYVEGCESQFKDVKSPDDLDGVVSNGGVTLYPNYGKYRALYTQPIVGLQPISVLTLLEYRAGSAGTKVGLQLNEGFTVVDCAEVVYVGLKKDVLLQDAINENKLFVMKADLQRLISNASIDPDDVKPEGAVSRKALLRLVIGMAVKGYNYDPSAKKNSAGTDIESDLQRMGISLGDDQIRKALKEAATLISPRQPA